jgi:uncharacterized protein (DUF1330 family)
MDADFGNYIYRGGIMKAYIIVNITFDKPNRAGYEEYKARAKPIVEGYGGKYIIRSENVRHLSSDKERPGPDRIVVVEFGSLEQLKACFASKEYNEILHLRNESVSSDTYIVEQREI